MIKRRPFAKTCSSFRHFLFYRDQPASREMMMMLFHFMASHKPGRSSPGRCCDSVPKKRPAAAAVGKENEPVVLFCVRNAGDVGGLGTTTKLRTSAAAPVTFFGTFFR
jgi:hypothetical protein